MYVYSLERNGTGSGGKEGKGGQGKRGVHTYLGWGEGVREDKV